MRIRTETTLARVPELSDAIQHYLREIYNLAREGDRVSVSAIARAQGVSDASASAMLKKLAALELVHHEPYKGVLRAAAVQRRDLAAEHLGVPAVHEVRVHRVPTRRRPCGRRDGRIEHDQRHRGHRHRVRLGTAACNRI